MKVNKERTISKYQISIPFKFLKFPLHYKSVL